MAGLKIQRNDTVMVITGTDKGKKGRVLHVMPEKGKLLVEHVRVVKKNVRPNPQRNIKGGIAEQESPIQISNVMLVCSNCGPTRVGYKFEGDTKVRVCKKCGRPSPPRVRRSRRDKRNSYEPRNGIRASHSGTVAESRERRDDGNTTA
jgi:large subunit ribosomal protein L24